MALHNDEYYAMINLRKTIKESVEETLKSSEVYQRIQGYIKLANDNSELVAKRIEYNNSLCYEGITRVNVSFNMASLLTSAYEVHISTYKGENFHDGVNIGIDSFIILLSECHLLKDE